MTAQRIAGLDDARDAAARGTWAEAYEAFRNLDADALEPADLDAYADAAWWLRRQDESLDLRQKAYAAFAAAGETQRAAHVAWFLFYEYDLPGETAIAQGWLKKAQRILAVERDCVEHAYLALAQSRVAFFRGDLTKALELAERAIECGQRFGATDVVSQGLQAKGGILIAQGEVDGGVELLDEAMASVLAGEVSSFFTGLLYCNVLSNCLQIGDLRRAGEWTEAARKWWLSINLSSPFHGICRVHWAEVATLHGDWEEAEKEGRRASEDLLVRIPPIAAEALHVIGEVCRRRGDFAGAEEAFTRALQLGRDPQPGLALVRLAQGKLDAAAAGIRTALAAGTEPGLPRARLLAAQVEVDLARGDITSARAAADELTAVRATVRTDVLHAMENTARAAISLAAGENDPALVAAVAAFRWWRDLRLPYEAAQTRVLIAEASARAGDEERARIELDAARAAFESLGAKLDVRRATELLRDASDLPAGLSAREVEVLRLVAAGKTNKEIAAEMVISEHTVSRHMQNIFAKLGVSTRAAATAFAFENQLV